MDITYSLSNLELIIFECPSRKNSSRNDPNSIFSMHLITIVYIFAMLASWREKFLCLWTGTSLAPIIMPVTDSIMTAFCHHRWRETE